jgi:hypothetical protein
MPRRKADHPESRGSARPSGLRRGRRHNRERCAAMRAKTERLRALRLAKEASDTKPEDRRLVRHGNYNHLSLGRRRPEIAWVVPWRFREAAPLVRQIGWLSAAAGNDRHQSRPNDFPVCSKRAGGCFVPTHRNLRTRDAAYFRLAGRFFATALTDFLPAFAASALACAPGRRPPTMRCMATPAATTAAAPRAAFATVVSFVPLRFAAPAADFRAFDLARFAMGFPNTLGR